VTKSQAGSEGKMGGVALPLNRKQLLTVFWAGTGLFYFRQIFVPKTDNLDLWLYGMVLTGVCLAPLWMWVTGRMHGLPLWPLFSLSFIPSYCLPLINNAANIQQYSPNEKLTAVLTLTGFLAVGTMVVHQLTNRPARIAPFVRGFDMEQSKPRLLLFVFCGVFFLLIADQLYALGGGVVSMVRGVLSSLANLGIFGLAFLWGQKKLEPKYRNTFVVLIIFYVLKQSSSLILASTLGTMGLALASFVLGRQKIPWAFLAVFLSILSLLHAGKYQMREELWGEGGAGSNRVDWLEMPGFYLKWMENGLFSIGKKETKSGEKVADAAERGVMVHLLLMVQQKTPSQVPFVEGETYRYLPQLLIPRIFTKDKAPAHVANMILSLHYGLLDQVGIWKTSIGFDPIVEAYANFGFGGVLGVALAMGLVIGGITALGNGTPLLSYRFLLAVLVLSGLIGSTNTMGVMVTVIWQSFLALTAVSFVLMKKIPNPLYVSPEGVVEGGRREVKGNVAGGQGGQVEASTQPAAQAEDAPARHERPTRFVYGEKKGK